jgi:hypothetical protein
MADESKLRKIEKADNPIIEEAFSNRTVAVMQKFNELAERHGINPADLDAKLLFHNDEFYLTIAPMAILSEAKLDAMLKTVRLELVNSSAIGDTDHNIAFEAQGLSQILDALNSALDLAPRHRGGFSG